MVILIPVFYTSSRQITTKVKMNDASDTVNALAQQADLVNSLGIGSKTYIRVRMPGGVESISIDNKEINIRLSILGTSSDVFAQTEAEVTGFLKRKGGIQNVPVEKLPSGIVLIGSLNDTEPPIIIEKSLEEGVMMVITDEYAYCKYDTEDKPYEEMAYDLTGALTIHTSTVE